jgi:heat shock protein HslJ
MSPAALVMTALLSGTSWVASGSTDQTLAFDNGKITTFTGCNKGTGAYVETDDGSTLTLAITAVTKMACGEEAMKAEQDWLTLAAKVRSFVLEDNELLLVDEAGATLATLAPKPDAEE